jgi:uncharacterized membrane protein YphA (DoxX/SURF4 family)
MALARALNPLRSKGTELPPRLLLAAKLIAFLLLWFGWPRWVAEPFLPFLSIFERIGQPAAVRLAIQSAAVLGALGVLFNVRPRAACLVLGAAILAKILASRPSYYNNEVFCAALFLMIGLYERGRPPWLLRAQVALVYFGAGLDKLLERDWRSGQFFEVWTRTIDHSTYRWAKAFFPPMLLSRLFCWATILVELSLAVLLLVPRARRWGILLGVFFHSALVLFAGTTFGFFYFSILASYLAFFDERSGRLPLFYTAYLALVAFSLKPGMDVSALTKVLIVIGLFAFVFSFRIYLKPAGKLLARSSERPDTRVARQRCSA